METLTAFRERISHSTTILYLRDSNNKVRAIYQNNINSPRKSCKSILIRGREYIIDWGNTFNLSRGKV